MAGTAIISYDGTENDDDALALGQMLAPAGFTLELAYVRHSREFDPAREDLAQHDAQQRLDRGAILLDDPGVARHVVFGASTGERLGELAAGLGASLVIFGSDYRTSPGHVAPGTSAQHLLDGSRVAVAIATAGLRRQIGEPLRAIAVPLAGPVNDVARQTARGLADRLGADIVDSPTQAVQLIVVGSQPAASPGHIAIGGDVRAELDRARSSVLVLPAEAPLLP